MWIDERGSEVLEPTECRRLLALGAKQHVHGHLGLADGELAPTVLPVNYATTELDVVVPVGESLFRRMQNRLVALQVDGTDRCGESFGPPEACSWSVLVRGLATETTEPCPSVEVTDPDVAETGHRLVRIRTDVLTGRKLGSGPADTQEHRAPSLRLVRPDEA